MYPINEHFDTSKFLQYGNFDFDNFNFLVMYEYDINKNYLKYGGLSLLNVFVEAGITSAMLAIVSSFKFFFREQLLILFVGFYDRVGSV